MRSSALAVGFRAGFLAGALSLSSGLLASCGSTPTLPLPPPVVQMLTAPDDQGMVTVQGQANEDAYVTVLNQQSDEGKITHAGSTGQFKVQIAAEPGDLLLIWQETDGVAGERTEQTVPAGSTP